MPYIGVKAEAVVGKCEIWNSREPMIMIVSRADKAGACHALGVEVGANFGAELAVKAANVNNPAKELLDLKIAVGSSTDLRVHGSTAPESW